MNDARRISMFDGMRAQQPHLPAIRAAIDRVLDSGRYVLGAAVSGFEEQFARWLGVGSAIGVANGSDALELALRAVGVGSGSTVITVANAGGYSTIAIRACGATPVYVDVDPSQLLMSVVALEQSLRSTPTAVIVTHLYGRMASIEEIVDRCSRAGVPVIEDCAQAHGAEIDGRRAGSFGKIGCFSFYPTKNLGALGDGGAVVTSDPTLAARLRALRQYGWSEKYLSTVAGGRNSRLDELQAAILSAKLPHLDAENQRRCEIARRYEAGIRNAHVQIMEGRGAKDDVVHLYVIRSTRRAELKSHLASLGIDSDIHYPRADYAQPAWRDHGDIVLNETELAGAEVLSLPCHPTLSDQEVARVIDAVCCFV